MRACCAYTNSYRDPSQWFSQRSGVIWIIWSIQNVLIPPKQLYVPRADSNVGAAVRKTHVLHALATETSVCPRRPPMNHGETRGKVQSPCLNRSKRLRGFKVVADSLEREFCQCGQTGILLSVGSEQKSCDPPSLRFVDSNGVLVLNSSGGVACVARTEC